MTIIDRRNSNKNKSVGNRQKFIERNKHRIKQSIDASKKGITDVLKDRKVVVDSIEEPDFNFDMTTGERDIVLPGNKTLQKGDKVKNPPPSDEEGTGGSETGEGLDEFAFTLTKEEFLELYFSDLKLPNFIKESLKSNTKHKWKRSGWSKEGVPARIDLVKTLKQAMARRIATRSERYLDDIDLRYRHFTKQPFPVKQATMICLMDTSGSMGEFEKTLAKKFFLLLYLFLNKCYTDVNVLFVSHTTHAKEVSEQEFFYGQESGGTIVSSGLQLVKDIIDQRIKLSETNVYIAQVSDGDNWSGDDEVASELIEDLLTKVQYFAYIQTEEKGRMAQKKKYRLDDLMTIYAEIATRHQNLHARHITEAGEVYPVLRSLFEGEAK
jgi:uncharacterized sporulation protein YeaH/YhbH (DUF444 family)